MTARRGKGFEGELRDSLRAMGAWHHGFDAVGSSYREVRRPADRIACWRGLSVLLEAKEVHGAVFPWRNLKPHQEKHLARHEACGGVSLLIIRWCIPRAPRAFLLPWCDYATIRADLPRASLPLQDSARPHQVLEVPRRRLSHADDHGPIWDLTDYFERVLHGRCL